MSLTFKTLPGTHASYPDRSGLRGRQQTTRVLIVLALLISIPGCVRRRMTIRSDPPGALVSIDQQEIGVTPVSTSFTYYGTRNFVVSKDHHETVTASRTFHPPWYEYPVLDFITENLWPFEVRDERVVEFQLVPKENPQPERLIERAQDLRTSANNGLIAPLPGTPGSFTPPETTPRYTLPAPEPAPSPIITPPRQ